MQIGFRWDDLKVLAALVRAGTLTGAAERLEVNPSTVGRRVDALEEALGTRLFDRTPDGVKPTHACEQLFPIAELFERAAADVTRAVEGLETEPEGLVRITAPPGVANQLVAPLLAPLRQRYPGLRIILEASIGYADLTRREADLALRLNRPRAGDLIATKLGASTSGLFAGADYVAAAGRVRDLAALDWIDWGPELAHLADSRWLRGQVPDDRIVLRTNAIESQLSAARAGVGALVMPAANAQLAGLAPLRLSRPLARSLPPLPEGELWLVGHRALRRVPRIAAVWTFLLEQARALPGLD